MTVRFEPPPKVEGTGIVEVDLTLFAFIEDAINQYRIDNPSGLTNDELDLLAEVNDQMQVVLDGQGFVWDVGLRRWLRGN